MIGFEDLTLEHFDRAKDHAQLAMPPRLRREESPHWHQGSWVLTRHVDVNESLRDRRLINRAPEPYRKDRPSLRALGKLDDRTPDQFHKHWSSFAERPVHADVRRAVRAESDRQMPGLERMFRSTADELLDEVDFNDEESLREDFVERFSAMSAAEMMGLSKEARRCFGESSGDSCGDGLSKSADRMGSVLSEAIANPEALRPGMISLPSEGCGAGRSRSEEGPLSDCVLFSLSVFANTRPMLEKSVGYLVRNPSGMERIHRDPGVLPAGVEEFTRCLSTTSYPIRVATADVEIGGGLVSEGDWIKIAPVAADHDPETFEDPDRIDLAGDSNPHVTFGSGTHAWVAAAVARTELQTSLACSVR